MSEDNNDNLPSIDDYKAEELPSLDSILEEYKLPSVEDFKEKEEVVEEEKNTCGEGEYFCNDEQKCKPIPKGHKVLPDGELVKESQDLTEVLHLINAVRKDIPEIPEIKYYDDELEKLATYIEEVKQDIPEIPEIKYYDENITSIEERISLLREEIENLPEVKYYEDDLQSLKENIDNVRAEIPQFPKWVNEVNEVPDFSWIGKTFSVIDDDFIKVNDHLNLLKGHIDSEIQQVSETFDTKDFEARVDIKEMSSDLKNSKDKIYKELKEAALKIWDHHSEFKDDDRKLKKQLKGEYNLLKQKISEEIKELNEKNISSQNKITSALTEYFNEVKEDISNLPEVKYYDKDIKKVREEFKPLSEELRSLREMVIDLKVKQYEFQNVQEGLLNIPPDEDNKDPLTPLDQNFVTLQELQSHYKLFVNRVTEQLATFGGGGAVELQYLDDITGIATNISAYDGMYLQVDTSQSSGHKFKFSTVSVGAGGTWSSNSIGVSTTKSVGIGTTTASSDYALYVQGDAYYSGNISAAGTITYEDVTNIDSLGIITGRSDLNILGNARIVGVLTAGNSSITIDGDNNTITVGNEDVVITNSAVTIGSGVTISATASGINSAPNVLYVAKDGIDTNNGTSIDNAFLTISAAVGAASSGTTVKVLSGKYAESNPISIPAFVSVVGDDQRTVEVSGLTTTSDIFHVRKGTKLANMTFKDHEAPAAAVAFPTGDDIAENVGGGKWKGPYIQNCTSDTTTGTGCYIDGDQAQLLKAMNIDAFTQYNQGGVGVAVTNGGFAQLVSLFTICCNEAVTCDKGGQADIANSNCSFGTYGLVARGTSDLQYTGVVTSSAAVSQANVIVNVSTPEKNISGFAYDHITGIATVTTSSAHDFLVGMGVTVAGVGMTCTYGTKTYPYRMPYIFEVESIPSTTSFSINVGVSTVSHQYVSGGTVSIDVDRPYDGQLAYFDTLYNRVQTITVTDGGSGYTLTPTITVDDPTGPTGETCTAYATLSGTTVSTITIISSGSQYTSAPNVTISGGGGSDATATASIQPIYYTINSSTPVVSGISTLTLSSNLLNTVGVGSTAYFSQGSRIVASSHTFEYVGAGNQIVTATPKRGGVTTQANEVVTEDGGKVLYTSTDQAGNFRIGDDLQINQNTGTISGRSFSKSLFNEMTPFILALS
jgi:hypothetical protein